LERYPEEKRKQSNDVIGDVIGDVITDAVYPGTDADSSLKTAG